MKEKLFLSSPDCDREHINKDFFCPRQTLNLSWGRLYVTPKHKYLYKNEVWKFLFIYDPLNMGLGPKLNCIT